jgi:hypothetical protein
MLLTTYHVHDKKQPSATEAAMATEAQKEIKRLHAVAREQRAKVAELGDAAAAAQAQMMLHRAALKNLLASCGCVPISALKGETVKDFRKVLAFMAACDAAKELVGED